MNFMVGEEVFAVVLAGGSGTRFWPRSRKKFPKQLCKIGGSKKSMIEQTLSRLDGFIPPERRLIVTHREQLALTKEIVGDQCGHFVAEPEAKNTAAALAMAAFEVVCLNGRKGNEVMISLHADHVIEDEEEFRRDLRRAVSVAKHGYLTLVGIKPRYPETGYGYIEKGGGLSECKGDGGFKVASFREKPNLDTAKQYISRGGFLWNSGYFIWKVETILQELQEHLPGTYRKLYDLSRGGAVSFNEVEEQSLNRTYSELAKIAIDNAVLEVSQKVAVIDSDFGWYDVGSWDALAKLFPTDDEGNFLNGDIYIHDVKNTTIDTDGTFVAVIGCEDICVVTSKDAVLVCRTDRAQDVKKVVEFLQGKSKIELI